MAKTWNWLRLCSAVECNENNTHNHLSFHLICCFCNHSSQLRLLSSSHSILVLAQTHDIAPNHLQAPSHAMCHYYYHVSSNTVVCSALEVCCHPPTPPHIILLPRVGIITAQYGDNLRMLYLYRRISLLWQCRSNTTRSNEYDTGSQSTACGVDDLDGMIVVERMGVIKRSAYYLQLIEITENIIWEWHQT